jgi:hypothetical protein
VAGGTQYIHRISRFCTWALNPDRLPHGMPASVRYSSASPTSCNIGRRNTGRWARIA